MILITGGTGFIGKALVRQLAAAGKPIRMLIRPSPRSPALPKGVAVEVAVCSLSDERGLRAAMKDVDVVYHLVGAERGGSRANLLRIDIEGSQMVSRAAADSGVERFFYLSHLGADRASAYPVLKAKAIAESFIRQSGVPFTILRTGIVYGPGDHFSTGLATLLHGFPGFFFIPDGGRPLVQPLSIDDLITSLVWALDLPETRGQLYSIGGPEILSFREITQAVMEAAEIQRALISVSPAYLRSVTIWLESFFPRFPVSIFWMDYLAADRTCGVDVLPRVFGLLPARFANHLDYLRGQPWGRILARQLLQRQQS